MGKKEMAYRPGQKQLATGDFWIGDEVVHVKPGLDGQTIAGIVIAHNHARGLIRVRWSSRVEEWVPPEEVHLVTQRG